MDNDKGGYRQINKSLNICAFDEYLKGQTARLPHVESVKQLTPRVLRILGQNPGKVNATFLCPQPNSHIMHVANASVQFTHQGTNTYIIGTGQRRLIIDTGGGEPSWAEIIASTFTSMNISLSHVLLTHWHGDHTGGVPSLLRLYPHLIDSIHKNEPDQGQQSITDGQTFSVDGATVRAIHVPGHSKDHMCFILEEENAMFTGDNILGHGTTAVEDLGTFMTSLEKMAAQNCLIGYSAHGATVTNLPSKISGELDRKWRREKQVMKGLDRVRSRGEKSVTVKDLVIEIYGGLLHEDTRTLALEPFIHEVLRKLAGDCKVAFEMRGGKKKWFSVEEVGQATTPRFTTVKKSPAAAIQV